MKMRQTINQTLYFVECDFGRLGRAFVEIDRDRNSRKAIIEDIGAGEYRDVLTVLEANPVTCACRDVTDEIMGEVSFAAAMKAINDVMSDPQAAKFDHARDQRKHEAA
jgi:hypothetical protein